MIFQSFILDNLVALCMKIMNSVVVVGLYYGFLTTFSIGPSYLFLLGAQVMEEGEEGTEKKVSATTGFITGQLMMLISIYYAPLHLALGRPHTITVIALPYLFLNFFCNNNKHFYYGSTRKNSMRNFSIQRVFLNNLILLLLNYFFLPSSMLVRLVNIYMFLGNKQILFLTSSFVSWLIGQILIMKWISLVLVWIQENFSIKSKKSNSLIRLSKYIMFELRNSMSQIFIIFFFISCLYCLGKTPPPLLSNKLKTTSERNKIKKQIDGSKIKVTKQEKKRSIEEEIFASIFSEEGEDSYKIDETEEKDILQFEKPLRNILFNSKLWNRPIRYIKKNGFENGITIKNEMSQYFFYPCQSDGKEKISFTYPPSLSTVVEMMQRKMSLLTTEKLSNELNNYWSYTNEKKRKSLSNKFFSSAKALDKKLIAIEIIEKRIRLGNDETKKKHLPKIYDPFLNGPYRGRIKKSFSLLIKKKTYIKNDIWINKIHGILFHINYSELEPKKYMFDRKSFSTEIRSILNLISQFSGKGKSVSSFYFKRLFSFPKHEQIRIISEDDKKKMKFLFDAVITDPNDKTVVNTKKSIGIKEIRKTVSPSSYKFIDELEEIEGEKEEEEKKKNKENEAEDYKIRSRKSKRIVIFINKNSKNDNTSTDNQDNNNKSKKTVEEELALIRYGQQSDFRRDIIIGAIRAQRRKTVIWKLFQANAHSPLFSDKFQKYSWFSFTILEPMKIFFNLKKGMWKNRDFQISDYAEDETEKRQREEEQKRKEYDQDEEKRMEIAETWDSIVFAQGVRGILLLTHAILRKYILFPLLIITKNILRMLFFQIPEWSQDLKDLNREIHIKCTYDGVPLSETEFPKNWLSEGIQIKILFPFRLKPWHRSKLRSPQKEKDPTKTKNKAQKQKKEVHFCFLSTWGMEVELPFGSPISFDFSFFFDPIFKELKKRIQNCNSFFFLFLKVLTKKKKKILNVSKERGKWIMKRILFRKEKILKEIRKKLSKTNQITLFELREIYEVSETQKDSIISNSNRMSYESSIPIQSINWTNFSLTEKKIKDLNDQTKTIIKQIEKITKNNKKGFRNPEINISFNKTRSDDKRKRFESPQTIWSILKRRNIRSIHKSYFVFQFFIERISIDIFLCIINIPSMNVQLFVESTKKIIKNDTYHNEANEKRIDKTNKKIIQFISIIKKSIYNIGNSQIFCDVPSFSQAYVFYKLSQTQVIDLSKYKLRSVFQYPGTSLFLKNEIKEYLGGVQGMCQSKLRHKKTHNSVMNQWKNWLRGHYQYDLSQSRWSILVSQKWRNRINECRMAQKKKKDLSKCDLYEKNQLILSKKQEVNLLTNRKKKIKKQYRYDLLSYKSLNYADKKDSSVSVYRSPLQANNDKTFSYNYSTRKRKLFDMENDITIKNYIGEDDIIDMEKNRDRQYFDWRLLNLDLRNKMDIEAWIDTDYYLMIHQEINPSNPNFFFDWMGMNVEILNRSRSNLELWLFLKFVKFYKTYTSNPWIIPIKFLFFNFNGKRNDNENKSITRKKKIDIFRPSSQKIKYKNNIEELNFLIRRYLRFQLKWNNCLDEKIMNNIEIYCLLLRLTNLKDVAISSIQKGDLSLDIMMIQDLLLPQLMKNNGTFVVEPVRLSKKNNGQFFMYQTIGISLIHKSKHKFQFHQRYPEKSYVNKTNFDEPITRHQKMTENKEKNHYDLLVPENILSSRRRRELRILICFNSGNRGGMHQNRTFYNGNKVNNLCQVFAKRKYLDRDKKKLIYFKLFLWPNYRVEDLVCMNRYWFDTNNSSRFGMVRIHMYPRLKIR